MRGLERWTRLALVAWAMAVTMARAVRYPNDFAEAHWLLDYRFGFIRRGFAGTLLSLASSTGLASHSEQAVAAASVMALVAFVLLLLWAASRVVSSDTDAGVSFAAAAIFATSPFVVMTAHFMGYLDHLFLAAAFAAAWLARSGRIRSAAALSAVGVLVHESFVLVGLPLVLLGAALRPEPRRRGGSFGLLPLGLPVVVALALGVSEAFLLDRVVLRNQLVTHLSAFPFVGGDMNLFVPEWLTTGTLAAWREQRHAFWRHLADPNLLRLMVPSAALLVLAAAAVSPPGTRGRRGLGVAAAALAPLALHAVAWDTARIWTYTIAAGFGGVWLCSRDSRVAGPGRRWFLAAAVPVIAANLFARSPLMDGEVERFTAATRALLYLPFLAGASLAFVEAWRARKS
ncbi:MAG TPA: hypothetical protein VLN08_06200 [Vicinamibacterales bacterium]|nr:hypothetical protein [Vicinamibacterales bacterium]